MEMKLHSLDMYQMKLEGIFDYMSLYSIIMSCVCTRSFCNGEDINCGKVKRIIFKKKCKITLVFEW